MQVCLSFWFGRGERNDKQQRQTQTESRLRIGHSSRLPMCRSWKKLPMIEDRVVLLSNPENTAMTVLKRETLFASAAIIRTCLSLGSIRGWAGRIECWKSNSQNE